jgi:hypothetical protein
MKNKRGLSIGRPKMRGFNLNTCTNQPQLVSWRHASSKFVVSEKRDRFARPVTFSKTIQWNPRAFSRSAKARIDPKIVPVRRLCVFTQLELSSVREDMLNWEASWHGKPAITPSTCGGSVKEEETTSHTPAMSHKGLAPVLPVPSGFLGTHKEDPPKTVGPVKVCRPDILLSDAGVRLTLMGMGGVKN